MDIFIQKIKPFKWSKFSCQLIDPDVAPRINAVQFHCKRRGRVIDSKNDDAASGDARFRALRVQMCLLSVLLVCIHICKSRVQNFPPNQLLVQRRNPKTLNG